HTSSHLATLTKGMSSCRETRVAKSMWGRAEKSVCRGFCCLPRSGLSGGSVVKRRSKGDAGADGGFDGPLFDCPRRLAFGEPAAVDACRCTVRDFPSTPSCRRRSAPRQWSTRGMSQLGWIPACAGMMEGRDDRGRLKMLDKAASMRDEARI